MLHNPQLFSLVLKGLLFMRLSVRAVILEGGKGTRLVGIDAKPLAPLLGKKLIDYPLNQVLDFFRSENLD